MDEKMTSLEEQEREQRRGLPVIDIEALWRENASLEEKNICVCAIGDACREEGFFYVVNHGVDWQLQQQLEEVAREYFTLTPEEKREISMEKGGLAWRGSFLVGDELTSGVPDQKEGIYYGEESHEDSDIPLHGKNLFHKSALGNRMREIVLSYMEAMKNLGRILIEAVASSLSLQPEVFGEQFHHPTQLFRMFHYPPHNPMYGEKSQAVGEHTDYGYLTILKQDQSGGLQVKSQDVWIEATPIENSFVINLGDALEHNTGGVLRATPHRVAQRLDATSSRFSFPYFYDPSFNAVMKSVISYLSEEDMKLVQDRGVAQRWDSQDPKLFQGTYGEYLLKKVSKVFPLLAEKHDLT